MSKKKDAITPTDFIASFDLRWGGCAYHYLAAVISFEITQNIHISRCFEDAFISAIERLALADSETQSLVGKSMPLLLKSNNAALYAATKVRTMELVEEHFFDIEMRNEERGDQG